MFGNIQTAFKYLGWIIPFIIGLAGAYAVGGFLFEAPEPGLATDVAPAVSPKKTTSEVNKDIVLAKNILALARSQPQKASAPAALSAPGRPETWPLIGVLVGGTRAAAILVIDGQTQIIILGEEVHGWTLAEIQSDKVRWTKNGESYIALLVSNENAPPEGSRPQTEAQPKRAMVERAESFSDKASIDKQYAKSLIENPAILLEQALYKPYKQDGKIIGFSVRNIQDDSVLKKIGMENNDVLMRLNGEDIQDPVSLMQAYAGLDGSNAITLDVLRDGKVKSILLELQ